MPIDLRPIFAIAESQHDALEAFIGERLFVADVWESPRTSDGIEYLRTVQCEPNRVQLAGRIYTIVQALHSFWLDVEEASPGVKWTLYFDVIATSPRRARNAVDSSDDPKMLEWQTTLTGQGDYRDGNIIVADPTSPG